MPKKHIPHLRCPSCRAIVLRTDTDFPFCSDRCRSIDLGKWASGVYKVSSPILDPDVLDDLDNDREHRIGHDAEDGGGDNGDLESRRRS